MVQYYTDLWARYSKMPAQLTSLIGECLIPKSPVPTRLGKVLGTGMRYINKFWMREKATIAKDVTLAYPNYSKEFEIYSDASLRKRR